MNGPKDNRSGTALLATLLAMAVIAAIAMTMLDQVRYGTLRTGNVRDMAQMQWAMRSADTFARNWVETSFAQMPPLALNKLLQERQVHELPQGNGELRFVVEDGSNCFALGSLITPMGLSNAVGQRQLVRLLQNTGWDKHPAQSLAANLSDWMDRDNRVDGGAEDGTYLRDGRRAANTAMTSITELREIAGMDEETFRVLAPHLCVSQAGEMSQVNINTMGTGDAPLLSALLGQDSPDLALRLLQQRPETGFSTEDELRQSPVLRDADLREADFTAIGFQPQALDLHMQVKWLDKTRRQTRRYEIATGGKVKSVRILPHIPLPKEKKT